MKKTDFGVAVVGVGYFGPNWVRNLSQVEDISHLVCCDLVKEKLRKIKKSYPQVKTTTNYNDILQDESIKAVVIVTPIPTHYSLAKKALLAGKDVLLEKPMTEKVSQSEELVKIAKDKKRILMVDHTFLYTPAIRKIKKIIKAGGLGRVYYFDSVRINLGLFQPATNALWDLAPHDISIMIYLLNKMPKSVSAFGTCHVFKDLADTIVLNFRFGPKTSAHIHVSWLSPVKIRRTLIGGSKKMIVYDDLEISEKIKVYDRRVMLRKDLVGPPSATDGYHYRVGDIHSPALEKKEALATESLHFIDCIKKRKKPLTDGKSGLEAVKVLEATALSLKNKGQVVKIK